MGLVVSFLSKLDAAVQKRFDSVCFFLMRRFGVRKSSIRYALNAIAVLACVGEVGALSALGIATGFTWFWQGLLIVLLLAGQKIELDWDREAEARPGTASSADKSASPLGKILSATFLLTALAQLKFPPPRFVKAGLTEGQHLFPVACGMLLWTAWLAAMYLRKTPMNPPAEKEKSSAFDLQPAPAET